VIAITLTTLRGPAGSVTRTASAYLQWAIPGTEFNVTEITKHRLSPGEDDAAVPGHPPM
jgi:hypothetical protein